MFLQAFESIKGACEVSLDRCLIAKNFVENLAIRNDMLGNRDFRDRVLSHARQLLKKVDPDYRRDQSDSGSALSYA